MSRLIKQVFEEINSKQGDGLNSLLEKYRYQKYRNHG
jgi:hypothetical protein